MSARQSSMPLLNA